VFLEGIKKNKKDLVSGFSKIYILLNYSFFMGLEDILNKSSIFRSLALVSLTSLFLGGCDIFFKKDENPVGPQKKEIVYVEDEGNTGKEGELNLKVSNETFSINVVDEYENPLENINVVGNDFGEGNFAFKFTDPDNNYFSHTFRLKTDEIDFVQGIDSHLHIDINEKMNEIRGRKFIIRDENMLDGASLFNRSGLDSLTTATMDEILDVYLKYDIISKNIDELQFNFNNGGFSVALNLAYWRQNFFEDLELYNAIVDKSVQIIGRRYQSQSMYFVFFENNLHALTQTVSRREFATIENIFSSEGVLIPNARVEVVDGPERFRIEPSFSDEKGISYLKFLIPEMNYDITASASGFITLEKTSSFDFNGYQYPTCEPLEWSFREKELSTFFSQPGREDGKDANVYYTNPTKNYGDNIALYVSNNPYGNGEISRSYLFLDVSSIPLNSNIISAKLRMRGTSGENLGGSVVTIKKVLDYWREDQINWNNQPRFDSYSYDSYLFSSFPDYEWKEFNLVDLVQEWVTENNNKGIAFVSNQESGEKATFIYSSDYGYDEYENPDFRYSFTVVYKH